MPNHTPKTPQLPLLPEATAFEMLDRRVRSSFMNDELYVSVLDLLEFYGNKKNPSQAWRDTLAYMERQGASLTPFCGLSKFIGKTGKMSKPTPMINLNGFLRIVQSADVPEWEHIRQWLADTGERELKSKASRERDNESAKLHKAGYGQTPEVIRFDAYRTELDEYAKLKKMYTQVIEAPDYAALNNAEYEAFFGMFASQLKKVYGDVSIRSIMGTVQLETMIYAERRLREALATQATMTNERAVQIIKVVIEPLGVYLRGYTQLMNIDLVTGKSLLGDGKK